MSALGFASGEEKWVIRYYAFGGTGSGENASDPADMVSADCFAIPAGTAVVDAAVFIDTAVTGTTAIDVGDDDDADGYVPTASLTLGTPGVYGLGEDEKGAYLHDGTNTQSKRAKYYNSASSGKEAKVAFTGTATAGAVRVALKVLYLGR